MKTMLRLLLISAVALFISVPATFAQTPEYSVLPVDEPLDVGGKILQPGTYTIRVIPGMGDRNRVQITSPDLKTIYATVMTVPHDMRADEEIPNTTFVYYPAGEGLPRALRTWFSSSPPLRIGHDIIYEESRAKQLARLANQRVPAYTGEITETTELRVVTPQATVEAYTPPPPPVVTPRPVEQVARVEMPQSASNVPLIALLGLLSLGAAGIFRFARQA